MEKHVSVEKQRRREKRAFGCVTLWGLRVPGLEGGLYYVSVEDP